MTKAIVPTHTPNIEINEISEIKEVFFLAKKYLLAINNGTFIGIHTALILDFFSLFEWWNIELRNDLIHFGRIFCGIVEVKF